MRADVLGIPFDALTLPQAVSRALELMERPGPARVVTPNPEIVWRCQSDEAARAAVAGADLILADGVGVIKAAQKLGRPLPGRVPGIEWARALAEELARRGKRLYLLGGKPGVARAAADNLRREIPGLLVCGARDGYFGDVRPVLEDILSARPDVLFVCLGAPRQEIFMADHAAGLGNLLMAGLGGSLDVWAGAARRAPALFIRFNLEWLYRSLRHPSRLIRLAALPRFMRAVRRRRKEELSRG